VVTAGRQRLGRWAEERVARWYEAAGYDVVARNWRCREGELDLVVARPGVLVFVEVKARTSTAYGSPAAAVTWQKQQRLRRLALRFLEEVPGAGRRLRFDVACVLAGRVEVLESAF
jgi:putative endonuclease